MEPPEQIDADEGADYLEVISKAVFQSGVSWAIVNNKWEGFREAFCGFEPEVVAEFGSADIDRLAADAAIIRNRRKIEATIHNAGRIIEAEDEHGEFGCFYVLYVVKEDVPSYEDWCASRGVEPVALS